MAPVSHCFLLRNGLGMPQMEPLLSYTGDLRNGLNVSQLLPLKVMFLIVFLLRNRLSVSQMELW